MPDPTNTNELSTLEKAMVNYMRFANPLDNRSQGKTAGFAWIVVVVLMGFLGYYNAPELRKLGLKALGGEAAEKQKGREKEVVSDNENITRLRTEVEEENEKINGKLDDMKTTDEARHKEIIQKLGTLSAPSVSASSKPEPTPTIVGEVQSKPDWEKMSQSITDLQEADRSIAKNKTISKKDYSKKSIGNYSAKAGA